MRCCHRPSAPNADIPAAGPMPKPWRAARPSTSARPAAEPPSRRCRGCSAAAGELRRRRRNPHSPASGKPSASAVFSASAPARSMPSSARPDSCTPSSRTNAPAASCACPPARSIASIWFPRTNTPRKCRRRLSLRLTPTIGTPTIADRGTPTIADRGTPTIADRGTPTIGTPSITSTGTPTSIRDTRPPATHAIRTPTSIRDTHPSATQGTPPVQPCIGCNRCEPVCPENLAPRELLWLSSARKWDSAAELGLKRCIECRLCDRVCPSDIPLARIFGDGKQVLANAAALSAQAAHAKARFEAREVRLAAELSAAQARRAERLARQRPAQPGGSP